MISPQPFVDLHCHMLPGLDDGPRSWEESLAMAKMAAADGIATVVVTPHQLGNFPQNNPAVVRDRVAQFQQLLIRHGIDLRVLPGADVRIEPDLTGSVRADQVSTLADRRRHVLLELPHEIYIPLDDLLRELRFAGLVGVLSHPERNQGLIAQPKTLRHLFDQGCLFQVTAGSITGDFGSSIKKFSEWMVRQKLVSFISTDAHGTSSRPPILSEAFDRVADWMGLDYPADLCCRNPASVVSRSIRAAAA